MSIISSTLMFALLFVVISPTFAAAQLGDPACAPFVVTQSWAQNREAMAGTMVTLAHFNVGANCQLALDNSTFDSTTPNAFTDIEDVFVLDLHGVPIGSGKLVVTDRGLRATVSSLVVVRPWYLGPVILAVKVSPRAVPGNKIEIGLVSFAFWRPGIGSRRIEFARVSTGEFTVVPFIPPPAKTSSAPAR